MKTTFNDEIIECSRSCHRRSDPLSFRPLSFVICSPMKPEMKDKGAKEQGIVMELMPGEPLDLLVSLPSIFQSLSEGG
jgi:hypothetical protein